MSMCLCMHVYEQVGGDWAACWLELHTNFKERGLRNYKQVVAIVQL